MSNNNEYTKALLFLLFMAIVAAMFFIVMMFALYSEFKSKPCSEFENVSYRSIPARCIYYWQGKHE